MKLFEQGERQAMVAHSLRASRQSVSEWWLAWRAGDTKKLKGATEAGRRPRVQPEQLKRVEQELLRGARAHPERGLPHIFTLPAPGSSVVRTIHRYTKAVDCLWTTTVPNAWASVKTTASKCFLTKGNGWYTVEIESADTDWVRRGCKVLARPSLKWWANCLRNRGFGSDGQENPYNQVWDSSHGQTAFANRGTRAAPWESRDPYVRLPRHFCDQASVCSTCDMKGV